MLTRVSKRVEAELCKRMLHFELQDFVDVMQTDGNAVDEALDGSWSYR